MSGYRDCHDSLFSVGERALHVALQKRGERLLVPPFGMLWGERLHAIEREQHLEIHRLLSPERAIIVESGDPLRLRNKLGRALLRHAVDKSQTGLLGCGIVPRR